MSRSIGEAAAHHDVPAHVLRHWEDVGALRPGRTSSGHRVYGTEHDAQIELIKCGKVAGLSLEQITVMLHNRADERGPILRRRLSELDRNEQEIQAAKRLLAHVLSCKSRTACQYCTHPHVSFEFPEPNDHTEPWVGPVSVRNVHAGAQEGRVLRVQHELSKIG